MVIKYSTSPRTSLIRRWVFRTKETVVLLIFHCDFYTCKRRCLYIRPLCSNLRSYVNEKEVQVFKSSKLIALKEKKIKSIKIFPRNLACTLLHLKPRFRAFVSAIELKTANQTGFHWSSRFPPTQTPSLRNSGFASLCLRRFKIANCPYFWMYSGYVMF